MSSSANPPEEPSADPARPRRRSRTRRVLIVGGVVLLLLLGGVAATLVGLYVTAERSLQRVQVDGIEEQPNRRVGEHELDVESLEDVLHVLIVGSDRRDGLSPEERERLGTGDIDGQRTDTIMLVRMDPNSEDVSILSFPRDLLVTRCDDSRGKINAAYHIGETTDVGGPSCLVQTIKELSGLSIQHFVEVDFAGFLELVDMVEGVTVYLEEPIRDRKAHIDLEAGCHHLTGPDALGFVRTRKDGADYGRMARQQRFVKELTREATSLGNVLNVPRVFQMVEAAASAVTTDEALTLDKMRRIAFTLRDLDSEDIAARTVPGELEMINGIAFEVPQQAEAERLFAAFAEGELRDGPSDVAEAEDADDGAEDVDGAEGGDDAPAGDTDDDAAEDASDSTDDSEVAERPVTTETPGDSGGSDGGDDGQDPDDDSFYVGAQAPPASCR